ncbi:MAG: hypothetical protein ACOC7S_02860 [Planctomycetota bacterium]
MLTRLFMVFEAVDGLLAAFLPDLIRVCIWGAAGGGVAVGLYGWLSDQAGIAELKQKAAGLRARMLREDRDFGAFVGLARENLGVALRLCGKVLGPALVSFAVVLMLVQWVGGAYAYRLPESGEGVPVRVSPRLEKLSYEPERAFTRGNDGRVVFLPEMMSSGETVKIEHDGRLLYSGCPLDPPTRDVTRKSWWNLLFAARAGYVEPDIPVDRLRFGFQEREFVGFLPARLSSWEFPFFVCLTAAALAVKFGFRIR